MNELLASMGITVDLQFAVQFVIIYLFIIWIAVIIWVLKDISIRTNNVFFQVFCVLLVLIGTPFAVFLYLIVRPGKTLYERYYDEIEDNLEIIAELLEERRLEKDHTEEVKEKEESYTEKKQKQVKEKKYKLLAKSEKTEKVPEVKKKTTLKKKKF